MTCSRLSLMNSPHREMADVIELLNGNNMRQRVQCDLRTSTDHSMMTSFEAVHNILSGIKDKSNIWKVNTEETYHEEKK